MAEEQQADEVQEAPEAATLEVSDEYVADFEAGMIAAGHLAPQGDEEEAPAEEPEAESTSEETPSASSEGGEKAVEDGDLAAAIAAIRRQPGGANAPLDGMDRAAVLAWGAAAMEAHNASQEQARQLAELRKLHSNEEQSPEASEAEGAPSTDQPAGADLQGVLDVFRNEFGTEAADAMQKVMEPVMGQVASLQAAVHGMAAKAGQDAATAALGDLQTSYPALQRAEAQGALMSHAKELLRQNRSPDIATAMRDSALIFYGAPASAPAPPGPDPRELGVARLGGRNGTPAPKPMSFEQRMDKTIGDGISELNGRDDVEQQLLNRVWTLQ